MMKYTDKSIMTTFSRINREWLLQNDTKQLVAKQKAFADRTKEQRQDAIAQWWYKQGSQYALDWIRDNYRTHDGKPLSWDEPYFQGYMRLMCCPWVQRLFVIKGAQMGYSESMVAVTAFLLAVIRARVFTCVEIKEKLSDLVAPRFQRSFDAIALIQELRKESKDAGGRKDTEMKTRALEVGGIAVYFGYAGRKGASSGSGNREVTSSLSSVPADAIFGDEVESFPPAAIGILEERTSASELPTCPMRFGSTPGGEGGILDIQTKTSERFFDWSVTCPHCGHQQILDPFGNLFRPVEQEILGRIEVRYVDGAGMPLDWYCRDRTSIESRVNTHYVGCRACGDELTQEAILAGEYICRHTGESLHDFTARLEKAIAPPDGHIAIRMPRIASRRFNPVQRLRKLITDEGSRADAFQQGYGVVVSFGGGRIDRNKIIEAIGRPLPSDCVSPDLITVGVDQGVESHFAVVSRWFFDLEAAGLRSRLRGDDKITMEDKWVTARKELAWHGQISGLSGIIELVTRWRADFLGFDVNPETEMSKTIVQSYPATRDRLNYRVRDRDFREANKSKPDYFQRYGVAIAFNQVRLKMENFNRREKIVQGEPMVVYSLDRTVGLDAVRDRIYRGLLHLPDEMSTNPKDKSSYIYQHLTSEREKTAAEARWIEPSGEPDHFHHAECFSEFSWYVPQFDEKKTEFSFGAI